jgi:hypothetical protein
MTYYSIASIMKKYGGFGISLRRETPFPTPSAKYMMTSLIDANDYMTSFIKSEVQVNELKVVGQDPRRIELMDFVPFPELEEANRIYIEELKSRRKNR